MKKKPGFALRSVCGEQFLIAEGLSNIDFSKLIALNESSAYLWNAIDEGEEFTIDSLTALILEEYEVEENTARNDVKALVASMLEAGVIE
mgnify:CR=1 FL=1